MRSVLRICFFANRPIEIWSPRATVSSSRAKLRRFYDFLMLQFEVQFHVPTPFHFRIFGFRQLCCQIQSQAQLPCDLVKHASIGDYMSTSFLTMSHRCCPLGSFKEDDNNLTHWFTRPFCLAEPLETFVTEAISFMSQGNMSVWRSQYLSFTRVLSVVRIYKQLCIRRFGVETSPLTVRVDSIQCSSGWGSFRNHT